MKIEIIQQSGESIMQECDEYTLLDNCIKLYRKGRSSSVIETPENYILDSAYWGIQGFRVLEDADASSD